MPDRIGAGSYLISMSLAVNVWCIAMLGFYHYMIVPHIVDSDEVTYGLWLLGIPVGYLFFRLSRSRFQDLNIPGSWARVLAFPLLGVIVLPVLCFLSGPRYTNDFGDPPESSSFLKIMLGLVLFFVAMAFVVYVVKVYR